MCLVHPTHMKTHQDRRRTFLPQNHWVWETSGPWFGHQQYPSPSHTLPQLPPVPSREDLGITCPRQPARARPLSATRYGGREAVRARKVCAARQGAQCPLTNPPAPPSRCHTDTAKVSNIASPEHRNPHPPKETLLMLWVYYRCTQTQRRGRAAWKEEGDLMKANPNSQTKVLLPKKDHHGERGDQSRTTSPQGCSHSAALPPSPKPWVRVRTPQHPAQPLLQSYLTWNLARGRGFDCSSVRAVQGSSIPAESSDALQGLPRSATQNEGQQPHLPLILSLPGSNERWVASSAGW